MILLLLLLVTAIALGLAGLFELPVIAGGDRLTRRGALRGAFFTGALAAFVATPCTGPFMGAALGAALVLPAAGALAVFAGLGLGLALPFLLLGFVPALRRLLPRPGALDGDVPAHPVAADVPDRSGPRLDPRPPDRRRRHGARPRRRPAARPRLVVARPRRALARLARRCLAAVAAPLALLPTEPPAAARGAKARSPPSRSARPASPRCAPRGTPVFVYFTADWCLTCKVNERGAMASAEVADAFPRARHQGAGRRLDARRRGDRPLPRAPGPLGRAALPLLRARAARRRCCRRS